MLACKRGHEKVVSVLVAMGAEIFMRDCRARTARDTAIRRQHTELLHYLSTQVQISCIQEQLRDERTELLGRMRVACLSGRLQFTRDTAIVESLVTTFRRANIPDGPLSAEAAFNLASIALSTAREALRRHSDSSPNHSTATVTGIEKVLSSGGAVSICRNIVTALRVSRSCAVPPAGMMSRRLGYNDWQWPFILMRYVQINLTPVIYCKQPYRPLINSPASCIDSTDSFENISSLMLCCCVLMKVYALAPWCLRNSNGVSSYPSPMEVGPE
jgi:hypothetical protein